MRPSNKNTTHHDVLCRGLRIIVKPSGVKTFVLYRKINGRPERITLGRFPNLTVGLACAKANACNTDIARGVHPDQARQSLRDKFTAAELFEQYLERYANPSHR